MIINNFIKAYKGKKIWLALLRKYNVDSKKCVIMMPSLDKNLNHLALLHLENFLSENNYESALILTYDIQVIKAANLFDEKILKCVEFTRKNMELIMKYYTFECFAPNFVIISLTEPEGNNSSINLIGKHNVTVEDIICMCLYKLKNVPEAKKNQL